MSTLAVAQRNIESIRADLARAEADADKAKREEALAEIKRLAVEGARVQKEYDRLHRQVVQGQARVDRYRAELAHAWREYQTWSVPLDPCDFPSDQAIAERGLQASLWKREHERIRAEMNKREAETHAARLEAMRTHDALARLKGAIHNLKTIASGGKLGQREGGLLTVC